MDSSRGSKSYVLLLGCDRSDAVDTVGEAARMAGEHLHVEPEAARALEWIGSNRAKPVAIVLSMDSAAAAEEAVQIRAHFELAAVPIIGVQRRVSDLSFEEAFASGIDDVSLLDAVLVGRRLRQLEDVASSAVMRREDVVVIADPDRNTRLLLGRVFRDAGFQVQFALDAGDALRQSLDGKVIVVIISAELNAAGDDGEPLSTRAPRAGSGAAWIINTPPRDMAAVRARLGIPRDAKVTVHDAFAAPATLLFVANELLNKPAKDGRESERHLYGTSVRFRLAGRESDDTGYMYNVSKGGLYVRTLAPPERWDELWVEFTPPRSDRRVHLEGTAVWARRYGPGSLASVPTGFGVQITGGSKADLERYERGYGAFHAEREAWRESLRPAS
jgi:CheY-like chemotaxis protein/Tfp pilus assembly protein PilZ